MQNKNLGLIVGVLAVIILVGAYFLFQAPGKGTFGSMATSTGGVATSSILGSTDTTNGGKVILSMPVGGNGNFGINFDTSNLHVGDQLPPIKVNLPPNANGKVVVLALKPSTSTSSFATEILFAYQLDTTSSTTQFSGIKLSQYADGKTGTEHLAIQPGKYSLEAVLWDRNPFFSNKVYGDFTDHNNATAVLTPVFTIAPAR